MRALEGVFTRTRARNGKFPEEFLGPNKKDMLTADPCVSMIIATKPTLFLRLWVQSDNTVKEVRNQHGSKMMACMAQAGLWGVASCHHLQVGHTHEDIDAIFSLVAVALRTCQSQCLQTPMDVVKRIESKLSHLWTKKNLIFSIELVDTVPKLNIFWMYFAIAKNRVYFFWGWFCFLHLFLPCRSNHLSKVRDWVSILPAGVSLKNAFRARKWVGNEDQAPLPQSFTFMARAGQVVCWINFCMRVICSSCFNMKRCVLFCFAGRSAWSGQ